MQEMDALDRTAATLEHSWVTVGLWNGDIGQNWSAIALPQTSSPGDMLKYMRVAIVLVISMAAIPVLAFGPQESTDNSRTAALKKFIQARARQIDTELDETTRFSYAFVDLNGDGKDEAIVHVTGRSWCGTGGCQLYILTSDGSSYRFVARIPATRPPIRVLEKTNHGWQNISSSSGSTPPICTRENIGSTARSIRSLTGPLLGESVGGS